MKGLIVGGRVYVKDGSDYSRLVVVPCERPKRDGTYGHECVELPASADIVKYAAETGFGVYELDLVPRRFGKELSLAVSNVHELDEEPGKEFAQVFIAA